jgi:hypothetical protein
MAIKRMFYLLAASLMALALAPRAMAEGPSSAADTGVWSEFSATLLQSNENPPVPFTGAFGDARLVLDRSTRLVTFELEVTGIPSATLAHIHRGRVGENGPVVIDLLGSNSLAPGTKLTGSVKLTPGQVAEMDSGAYYVNVHTAANPTGELRGQVFPREATRVFKTPLLGANERPTPVVSPGSGLATIRLNDARTRFDYELRITGIPSATMAHIHAGPITGTGGVVYNFLPMGQQFTPAAPLTGTLALTEVVATSPITGANALLGALFNGGFYVNVHTVANPAGELRGQLGPATTQVAATLSGANEVPPVATAATGAFSGDLSLDAGQLEFALTVSGITSTITLAHIHEGAPGTNGPVVVDLLAAAGGVFTDGATIRGTVFLTSTEAISKALAGQYYINVHSASFPGGEVRGQLGVQQRALTYRAALSGANEVPPVPSQGSGVATMTLDTASYQLAYTVAITNVTSTVTLAHIHAAPVGVNGPVVFDLLGSKTLAPSTPLTGTLQLNDLAFDTLNTFGYYVNVHTQTFGAGELRGQLFLLAPGRPIFLNVVLNNNATPAAPPLNTGPATTPPTTTDPYSAVPVGAPISAAAATALFVCTTAHGA